MSYLRKNYILILTIACFIGCGNDTIDNEQKTEANNLSKMDVKKTNPSQLKETPPIIGHYKAIGYFDEKNNLIKIERFLNGSLMAD